MAKTPDLTTLRKALEDAGRAHHDYESVHLKGVRDAEWAGWYAAHVHGALGDFMTPTELTGVLENTETDGDWAAAAAQNICDALS